MSPSLGLATVIYALALAGWAAGSALRNRARSPVFAVGLIVLEAAVLIQCVLDAVSLLSGRHSAEVATNVGYVITSVLVLPVTAAVVRFDDGRWGSAALAFGCLVLVVVSIRMQQTLSADA